MLAVGGMTSTQLCLVIISKPSFCSRLLFTGSCRGSPGSFRLSSTGWDDKEKEGREYVLEGEAGRKREDYKEKEQRKEGSQVW